MKFSFHSHSGQFCQHGYGLLADLVENARVKGFLHLGLSEHQPRLRAQDLYPEEEEQGFQVKDLQKQFDDYVREGRKLQNQYKDSLKILVGMETEYIWEEDLEEIKRIRKEYNIDYLVGSIHHVHEIPIDFSKELFLKAETTLGGTDNLFCAYFDAQYKMMQVLKPEVIGHFDVIRLFKPDHEIKGNSPTWTKIVRNVTFAIEYGALFEINSRAFKKGMQDAYPYSPILKLIISLKGKFTLGDDSHGPNDVAMHYDKLLDYINLYNIREIYYLKRDTLHNPTEVCLYEYPLEH